MNINYCRRYNDTDIVSVTTKDTVTNAINLMIERNIGSVIVTEDGKPVGILTERDVIKKIYPNMCTRDVLAEEMVSKPLITIGVDAKLGEAAMLMMKRDVRRLLIEDKGKIVGICTQKNIMKATLETFMVLASI